MAHRVARRHRLHWRVELIRLFLALLFLASAVHAELTPQELRGRGIYRTGMSNSGTPVMAHLSENSNPVPASVLPCVSCHGRDGRGKDEGGVRPSNLQWSALTRPYAMETPGSRAHPPYTASTLMRAITMGIDSAKHPLRPPMPRYEMSRGDADDLVAYLRVAGSDRDPGVSDDALRIGVLLPPPGDERAVVQSTVSGYFADVNAKGGVFERRIEVDFTDTLSDRDFAVTAAYIIGREEQIGRKAAEMQLPVIAAFAAQGDDTNRYLFELLAGLEEQSIALINALPTEAKIRITHDASTAAIAQRLTERFGERVASSGAAVLFLGGTLPSPLPDTLLLPAPFTSDTLLSAHAQVLVALPLPPAVRPARAAALASSQLLVRALQRAGRDAGRESLIDALESFRSEETGITPPVTWTSTHHTGTSECVIVRWPRK